MTQNNKLVSGRLMNNLLGAWKGLSIPFIGKRLELSPYLHENEIEPLTEKITACLESRGGQASARVRAAELGNAYVGMNDEGRCKYLQLLVDKFGTDHNEIRHTAEALFTDLDATMRAKVEQELRRKLTPPYLTLLTQFNALPQGVRFLVDMRNDLLNFRREHPELESMNQLLQEQLSSWFDIGFLDLKRIDWNAPASLLEKLIKYEAVHRIESWDDLRHRLAANRRCFAFFHPRMPDDPLIFVWVALVDELSDNVDTLLDINQSETINEHTNTAIFYSITSTQRGLSGVSLGDFLIKRVVDELRQELPQLTQFSTLSPIPGLADWLQKQPSDALLSDEQKEALAAATERDFDALISEREWLDDENTRAAMQEPLTALAARYITREKRGGRATDAVAHFHLTNGAIVERINWRADTSERGKQQSYTLMVNYLYDLDKIEVNHENYVGNGAVAQSRVVEALSGE